MTFLDPGYLSEAAWRQDWPYNARDTDAENYDIQQDERWDEVAGSDYLGSSLRPDPDHSHPGVGPAVDDFDSPQSGAPAGEPSSCPAGASTPF